MLATSVIAAAGAIPVALGLSATAAAEPAAPAPAPSVPGLPFLQQLAANPAAATQLMQGFTSLLGSAQAAAPATATPPPAATASVTLPQPPTALPGPAAPLNTLATTAAPAAAPQNLLTSVPGALASLMPAGTPLAGLLPTAATAPAAAAPAAAAAVPAATAPLMMPLSALP